MSDLKSSHVLAIRLNMAPAKQVKGYANEVRMIYDVRGGSFEGSGFAGQVMPVVGDWVIVKNGSVTMDVRVKLRADSGAELLMSYDRIGELDACLTALVRDLPGAEDSQHYFRVKPVFETKCARLAWLAEEEVFAIGIRFADAIHYYVFRTVPEMA